METRKQPPVKPRNFGPESRRFDELKGKLIQIHWLSEGRDCTVGKLLWVDRYSLGLDEGPTGEQLIYKQAIRQIGLLR
jgi:hypothetical protein